MKPIFVAGPGRSGTTILKRVLLQHPAIIGLPNELRILTDPGGALDLYEALSHRWGPYYADDAVHRFVALLHDAALPPTWLRRQKDRVQMRLLAPLGYSPRRYLGAGLSFYPDKAYLHSRLHTLLADLHVQALPGRWMGTPALRRPSRIYETGPLPPAAAARHIARFCDDLYSHMAAPGHSRWLDDTPTTLLHARRLLALFPDLQLIHVVRDPRDVLASASQFAWGGGSFAAAARRLAAIYERWFEIRPHLPPAALYEVRLEHLAADPASHYRRLCDFLGLPFTAELLALPLDQTHSGRWRRDIPAADWQICEPLLRPYLTRLGYEE